MTRSRFFKFLCVFSILMTAAAVFSGPLQADAALLKRGKLSSAPRQDGFTPEPLANSGTIAVLVKGVSDQHNASVAALVCQRLASKGYRVVDPQKLSAIRQSRIAIAALDGDVDAIIRLSSQYGVGTTITLNAQAGKPVVNEFQLLTGTSSVAVMAIKSSGNIVYSDTVQGKQVGYTPDEAAQKAIEAAALLAVDRMTQ